MIFLMSAEAEQALIARCIREGKGPWRELMDHYGPGLHSFVGKILGSNRDLRVDETCQDVWSSLVIPDMQRLIAFHQTKARFAVYLNALALREILQQKRMDKRRRRLLKKLWLEAKEGHHSYTSPEECIMPGIWLAEIQSRLSPLLQEALLREHLSHSSEFAGSSQVRWLWDFRIRAVAAEVLEISTAVRRRRF